MTSKVWKWVLGLIYIVAVATIWIAASFVVQSVVDAGVSPFLITYICNSLFLVYIPIAEIGRYLVDTYGSLLFWKRKKSSPLQELGTSEQTILLGESDADVKVDRSYLSVIMEEGEISRHDRDTDSRQEFVSCELERTLPVVKVDGYPDEGLDAKRRWTRTKVAKSNTILSSASSLFTFLVSLAFLGEKFTCIKFISVLLCMAGTIVVSLGDSESSNNLGAAASNPLLGDSLALVSAGLYAVYITLIRKKLPDDDGKSGQASMALFLGYVGLFNLIIFLPVALILNFTKLEPFYTLTLERFGLIVGKGLLDNVLSDYLWAKAVLLTTTTVATAGLTIQVPLAAVVDSLMGNAPHLIDYLGAVAVMIGFAGINIPSETFCKSKEAILELETINASLNHQERISSLHQNTTTVS
ncbi:uncharacterized vacuolar membrane protein YML018C-like isoform X2 [Mangifera indica]|uniref:uncharacterized vacuolar membrane protein YML018C-like isoform X2 n=1 Tax=Mangifera indica TaxID=29780 RepID=UPI001CFA781B|nr:uncharacterized vacuolar membrane protein YML018C-like isoform X2 [Mangifera indica]